jgi:soluble lytic murein transglycosylase-like protein
MKNIVIVSFLVFLFLFLGSSLPYEPLIIPPCTPVTFIYRVKKEPERTPVPPRRAVPLEYRSIIDAAAISAGIPHGVLESIAFVESGFNPSAISPAGTGGRCDLGMFQFNSKYLEWYAKTYNSGIAFDPLSPWEAAMVTAKHIRFLYDRYGHWPTVCLAYNAGMAAVDNDRIPDCSFRYLQKIYEDGVL